MKYLSDMSVADKIEDCESANEEVKVMCNEFRMVMSKVHTHAKEAERQLRTTDVDLEDTYHPIVQSMRLLEEIINETT